jgi:hypothetical protein
MIEAFTDTVDSLMAKSVNTPEIKTFLADLGETKPLTIDPDFGGADVSRPLLGFSLFFRDPARTKSPVCASLPRGILVLAGCFFYSEGHEGYKQFSGKLPRGLSFSDSRDRIIQALGQPNWKREKEGRTISERWDYDKRSLHITYPKDRDGIKIISFELLRGQ